MSMVVPVDEGREMVRQMRRFDGMYVAPDEFGRLSFAVDVGCCTVALAESLVDELNQMEGVSVYISSALAIDFDYYITRDLLAPIRGVVDYYISNGAKLIEWRYGDDGDDGKFY